MRKSYGGQERNQGGVHTERKGTRGQVLNVGMNAKKIDLTPITIRE
jgi:hypothetical protein